MLSVFALCVGCLTLMVLVTGLFHFCREYRHEEAQRAAHALERLHRHRMRQMRLRDRDLGREARPISDSNDIAVLTSDLRGRSNACSQMIPQPTDINSQGQPNTMTSCGTGHLTWREGHPGDDNVISMTDVEEDDDMMIVITQLHAVDEVADQCTISMTESDTDQVCVDVMEHTREAFRDFNNVEITNGVQPTPVNSNADDIVSTSAVKSSDIDTPCTSAAMTPTEDMRGCTDGASASEPIQTGPVDTTSIRHYTVTKPECTGSQGAYSARSRKNPLSLSAESPLSSLAQGREDPLSLLPERIEGAVSPLDNGGEGAVSACSAVYDNDTESCLSSHLSYLSLHFSTNSLYESRMTKWWQTSIDIPHETTPQSMDDCRLDGASGSSEGQNNVDKTRTHLSFKSMLREETLQVLHEEDANVDESGEGDDEDTPVQKFCNQITYL